MNELNKTQVVMLVLLVSFVTSLVTGIVTVTLVNQAPQPMTQTISKVIEKTIERVVPGEPKPAPPAPPIIITQEDLIIKVVRDISSAVVSVVATKDIPIIEKYYINPFKENELFKNLPEGFLPNIQIPQYREKGTEEKQVSGGTGFFVSPDGLILTNKHVVEDEDATYSIIMNDGSKSEVEVLARDPFQDIAILKIKPAEGDASEKASARSFNFIPLGDSSNTKVGQTVVAIGNALGELQNTVSVGIISGLNRSVLASGSASGPEQLRELIQTDASINPGNSGGPLLDLAGRVLGINTAMAKAGENVGFALPINIAKRDIADVKEFGKIKYAYLGIRYLAVDAAVQKEKDLPVDYGFLLVKGPNGEPAAIEGSPAREAGLKEGDIILEMNGAKLGKNKSLALILNELRVGEKITLKIKRGEEELNVEVALKEKPEGI